MVGVGADCGVVALLSRCPFGRPGDNGTAVHAAAAGVLLACCCCCCCAWSAMAAAVLRCSVRELGHSGELGKGFQRACGCEEVISGSGRVVQIGAHWCKGEVKKANGAESNVLGCSINCCRVGSGWREGVSDVRYREALHRWKTGSNAVGESCVLESLESLESLEIGNAVWSLTLARPRG